MARGVGQHHGDLRRALLDAALELVAEGADPGLRAVARRAGVSPGAPYHHFADKSALLAEVAREGFVGLAAEQAQVGGEGGERLAAMVATYVRFALDHPTHYRVMFEGAPASDPDVSEVGRATFVTLTETVRGANPRLAEGEAVRRAAMIWAMAHGTVDVVEWLADLPGGGDPDSVIEEVGRTARTLAEA